MLKKKITQMLEAIKEFFIKSNGILLLHKYYTSNDVNDFYLEVTRDLEMKKLSEDKRNMKQDGANLRRDINKAVSSYHSEFCNG
ncbi:hypothetical protein [Mucilaginibacter sp. L196]|uniref:hypothetical protein n=1 Tax=Mucilaginibacter sp. L196 TaxID=1641870 RepID=UPI00131E437C|nr:hypothetical protein [Mucilaginibacter sp. L196]